MDADDSAIRAHRAGSIIGDDTPASASPASTKAPGARSVLRRLAAGAFRRRKWVFAGIGVAVVAGALAFSLSLANKLMAIRYRIQLIEARQESLGRVGAAEAIREQAARGPARFATPPWPADRGEWKRIGSADTASGWPADFRKSKALVVHQDRLYTGLSNPHRNPPQVWRYDGTQWARIGSEETVAAWARYSYVSALISDGNKLYAGIDDTVWAFDDRRGWHQIGGDGRAASWPSGLFTNAYSLAVHKGRLFVGMVGTGRAAVYAYAGGQWEQVAGDGVRASWSGERYTGVYEVWSHTDGYLYAGLIANPGPTAVYRYDGAQWEKIGGDGINGSWRNPGHTYVFSFASLEGRLVVSMNRHPMVSADFSSVWAFDGKGWQPVGLGHIPSRWGEMHNYNAVAAFNGALVIGAGGNPAGNASLWTLRDGHPELFAGHGANKSWGKASYGLGDWLTQGNIEYVYRLVPWRGDLYVGFGDDPGMATVWRYRPQGADANGQR